MRITKFTVPPAAYPRYNYTREHVIPLLKRFRELSKKCYITDPFEIPSYSDVSIYVISGDESDILSFDDIANRCSSDIKRNDLSCLNVDAFRNCCPDNLATVYVASYKKAQENEQIFEYFGRFNVLIVDEPETVMATTPECKSVDEGIICVRSRQKFAQELGILLERVIFRDLFQRVKFLQAFLELEQSAIVFAALDQETQAVLNKRFDKSRSLRSSAIVERDPIHLHDEWCTARLIAVKNKIVSLYNKSVPMLRNQLLDMEQEDQENGRKITPLKICEQIMPFLEEGESTSEARQVPESLQAQIKVMQKSQETSNKAVRLETRLRKHLDGVYENRDETEQLLGACMGMYHRSKVPEYERPTHSHAGPSSLKENVAKDILAIRGVTGCGFRYKTLDVYVADTLTEDENLAISVKVDRIAEENGISEYKVRTEQEKLEQFADYQVGSKVTSRLGRSASLGGFAHKGENRDLCMLVARHLADDGKPLFMTDASGQKTVVAYVLEPKRQSERFGSLDIAVANVLKRERPKCLTKFKDASGLPLESAMIQFVDTDIEWLKGLPVHIWGAASSPGLGTVIIPDFYVEGMKRLVKIEDRHPVDSDVIDAFCKSGDSGALVCADDPDGEVVHVISLVMGSSNFEAKEKDPEIKGEYLSIRLKDGIAQLGEEHEDTFTLC